MHIFLLDFWNREEFDKILKDTYNSDMVYLEKACGSQNEEQRHRTLSKLVLKRKFCDAVPFVNDREKGGFLQPYELAKDCTGTINKTVT